MPVAPKVSVGLKAEPGSESMLSTPNEVSEPVN